MGEGDLFLCGVGGSTNKRCCPAIPSKSKSNPNTAHALVEHAGGDGRGVRAQEVLHGLAPLELAAVAQGPVPALARSVAWVCVIVLVCSCVWCWVNEKGCMRV